MRLPDSPIAAVTQGRVVGVTLAANALAGRKLKRMKQKYEGKDLQGLVDLGREQGYLTFEQVNDYLPQDVASPTDLRAALDSFEDLDIKVLEEVPTEGADEVEVEGKEDPDEERGPEADERQLKRLMLATKKLTDLRAKIEAIEEELHNKPGPRRKPKLDKNLVRYNERVKKELRGMLLSRRLMEAVIAEMRDFLQQYRYSQHTILKYEEATGRSRTHLLKAAADAEDRRHALKINDVRENLLDIAAKIRQAQKTVREVEKKVKDTGEEFASKLETIAAGQDKSRRAKKEVTDANLRLVVSLAKRSTNRSLGFLDLIPEGNIGLIRALAKFEDQRGSKF